jgi:hypothetical protein
MTSARVGTLTSQYPPLLLLAGHSPASAIDLDLSDGPTESITEVYRAMPDTELVANAEWNPEQRRFVERNYCLPTSEDDIAFPDYPENVTFEAPVLFLDPFYRVDTIEVWNCAEAEVARNERQAWGTRQAYRDRIESLRSDAEIEGFTVSSKSERDLWSFIRSIPFARRANLVLLENGNLRAVWDGEDNSHLGLQFLGEHTVQYVIFRRRAGSHQVSRVAGRDTIVGVKKQMRSFNLEGILRT